MKASDSLKLFCADPYTGWVPREKQQDELRKIAARVEEVEQRAEELEHALEDARDEFFGKANLPDGTQTRAEIIAEYAAKLRLAGEDE